MKKLKPALTGCFLLLFSVVVVAKDEALQSIHMPEQQQNKAVLSPNEPMYLTIGGGRGSDIKARFQFSFKYKIFDGGTEFIENHRWLDGFYFAYSQTSLWNLSEDSAPFEDSSYRPSFFWDIPSSKNMYTPAYYRTGYEHESNGQAEEDSRSIDTLFVWPVWAGKYNKQAWIVAPKFYGYVATGSKNEDIADYRGYVDLWLRYGKQEGVLYSMIYRQGKKSSGTTQLEISYPVKQQTLARTGGFIFLQLFDGYGESLLTYDERRSTILRVGYAIVR